jgi:FlgD Ig-like domain/Fibronectin type III domain/FG-GAP-like repeat
VDWDEDGDLDLLVGERNGYVNLYINSGTATNPVLDAGIHVQDGQNDMQVGNNSSPLPVDWDNDGDKDLMMGTDEEGILMYLNIGTNEAPVFDGHTVIIAPQISYPEVGNWRNRPRLTDLNFDGLVDILTGNENGMIAFYENIGTAANPAFSTPPIPLCYEDGTEINITARTYLELFDWDFDGHDDLIIGAWDAEVYYLRQIPVADPNSPAIPSDFIALPDAGGALSCDLSWINPSLNYAGQTLTELDEMRLYRNGNLIYTDSNPTIGGASNYTDVPTSSGLYNYLILGYNSFGEGHGANVTTWVGEDVPGAVENLVLIQTSPGVLSGTITWDNPAAGLNGGAFNNPIGGYHIERNDGITFELNEIAASFVDDTIPSAGSYCYTVVPHNIIGDGGNATSNLVLIADAGLLLMEDFSSSVPPIEWYIDGLGQTNWSSSATNNAGGSAPEAMLNWSPSFVGMSRMCSYALDTSGMTEIALEFKHNVNDYAGGYTLGVATSSDGTTWNDVWSIVPAGAIGPETISVDITTADVGSATFQICFYLDGDSFQINYWYIDDVLLTGAGGTVFNPPSNLVVESNTADDFATFTWDAPMVEDLTGYNIYLDGVLQGNTSDLEWVFSDLANGTIYEAGVVAVYDEGTSVMVTVEFTYEGTGTGNNLPLVTELKGNYPNPFNPETTISFSIKIDNEFTVLEVFNVKGQKVKTIVNEELASGQHSVVWNGTDDTEKSVSSGVYFYKMKAGSYQETKKMILMK